MARKDIFHSFLERIFEPPDMHWQLVSPKPLQNGQLLLSRQKSFVTFKLLEVISFFDALVMEERSNFCRLLSVEETAKARENISAKYCQRTIHGSYITKHDQLKS